MHPPSSSFSLLLPCLHQLFYLSMKPILVLIWECPLNLFLPSFNLVGVCSLAEFFLPPSFHHFPMPSLAMHYCGTSFSLFCRCWSIVFKESYSWMLLPNSSVCYNCAEGYLSIVTMVVECWPPIFLE
ncbi:unnamed protein product [Victoria cruziana]